MAKTIVKVRDLRVTFKNSKTKKPFDVIRGIDFDIKDKEIVGFIGESGSGKSVTAKSLLNINGELKNSVSSLIVDGTDLVEKGSITKKKSIWKQIRGKKIAYIPQDAMTSLNPTSKISTQIVESLQLHYVPKVKEKLEQELKNKKAKTKDPEEIKKLEEEYKTKFKDMTSKKALREKGISYLKRFKIPLAEERFDSYPHQFSGGMRQRAIIAMIVACQPELIIADEPTTALDPTVQAEVLKLLKEIKEEFGISIIFISHDIAVISTICDYVYVFYAGRVIEKGKISEIFTDPRHPYTWALLSAMPDGNEKTKRLETIPGTPPDFNNLPIGDPFSVRNKYAMEIDFIKEPPLFEVTKTHSAATWLLHPSAKKVTPPAKVKKIIKEYKK